MKIILLTPGTGNFHCGSCLRDHLLVKALRQLGHDATMVPLYLPLVLDGPIDPADDQPLHFGGMNVYLQQKSVIFRHTPRWIDRLLNAKWLLGAAAARAGSTQSAQVGRMTASMLRGEDGRQRKELDKLVDWLLEHGKPQVVCLSNGMLVGMARQIKDRLGSRVLCLLAGEDSFLDGLPSPHDRQAWEVLRQRAADVDGFVPVSRYYAEVMMQRLGLDERRVHVVYGGIDLAGYEPAKKAPPVPTIGYLARMCPVKGLHLLVDAFVRLKSSDRFWNAKLHVIGAVTRADEPYVAQQRQKLQAAGVAGDAEFFVNVDLQQKQDLLKSLSVLSVPATYGEAFGLYLIEALACGVPFVQPRHGAFGELLEQTGGGMLIDSDDPLALADTLGSLLNDAERAAALGRSGRAAVVAKFTARRMAENFLRVCGSD